MTDAENCSRCIWSHDCKGVYETLGRAEGSSVVTKALAAFLLPILVFIICLVLMDKVLSGIVAQASVRIMLGVLGSLPVVFATVFGVAALTRRLGSGKHACQSKETHD
ncbi:MAG: hypothetical protein IH624_17485 [Phycisphaerae bacterium]|nr:hypothetical protein [Phycisphaerae bacterium]